MSGARCGGKPPQGRVCLEQVFESGVKLIEMTFTDRESVKALTKGVNRSPRLIGLEAGKYAATVEADDFPRQ